MISECTRATRQEPPQPIPLHELTTQQRRTLETIRAYWEATGEPCPGSLLSRRLKLNRSTVMKHVAALHRKGWLRSSSAPAYPRDSE